VNWSALLGILAAGVIGWLLYRVVRRNPESFSKANLTKSLGTMGLLALFLIAVIFIGVSVIRG